MAQKIKKQFQETEVYTNAEQDTGKVWIDGRVIYRRIIRGTINVVVGANTVAHGITGMSTSHELISHNGYVKLGSGTVASAGLQVLQHRETGGNWFLFEGMDTTNVTFTSSFAWGTSWVGLIIEYVK